MRKTSLLITVLLFFISFTTARTARAQQANEPAKIEVGIHFTSVIGPEIQSQFFVDHVRSEAGIGGRITYNLTRHVALEGEGNVFVRPGFDGFNSNSLIVQGQFGLKIGKRFDKVGIFAKGRPGVVSFPEILTQTGTQTIVINGRPEVLPILEARRRNFFSMDIGAVLEFYPSRRILVRFDAGDTLLNIGEVRAVTFGGTPPQSSPIAHKFQFSSGIAFRFLDPKPTQKSDSVESPSERKFEAGVQFSSLRLKVFAETQLPALGFEGADTQSGFGGRLSYNFTPGIAAEIQTDFFPVELEHFANGRAGGHMVQVQAGAKVGKRFEKFGLFGKARPGAISFSKTLKIDFVPDPIHPKFQVERGTRFSLDLGGVVEFYPSPRIVARFDGGDTIIHYGATQVPSNSLRMPIIEIPSRTRHQFQFSAGVGFRF